MFSTPLWIAAVASSGGAPFDPFAVAGAHNGFIADLGVTDIGGFADAIADQTGNSNTLAAPGSTQRPAIVGGWRNGRTALLGRADASTVYLGRATHANGALAQPFTRYVVGGWTAGTGDKLVGDGGTGTGAQSYAHGTTGRPSNVVNGTGAFERQAATEPANSTPFIWTTAFKGTSISSRMEPHGAAPIEWSGSNGNGVYNGIYLLGGTAGAAFNYREHLAFELDVAGDLPVSEPATHAAILQWLRDYYDIVHA